MKLQLTRPIAFFDIESTNKDPLKARIIELGIITLYPDGHTNSIRFLCNPEENITDENAAIHGLTNDIVKDYPTFKEQAQAVADKLKGFDLGTFNGNSYDIPLLNAEFGRAGIPFSFEGVEFVDAGNLFKILAPRTLTAAVLMYLGKDHSGAHGAIADTQATIEVLNAMIDRHPEDVPVTVPELALKSNFDKKRLDLAGKFAYNEKNEVILTFGKHKDVVAQTQPDYLKWMLAAKQPDGKTPSFTEDTQNVIMRLLNRDRDAPGPAVLPKFAGSSAGAQFKRV